MRPHALCLVVATLVNLAAPARADIASGLTNGLTAFDATTNAHNAVLTNFPAGNAQWVAGRTNGGLSFNATTNNQRAVIDDTAGGLNFGVKTNPTFSVAVWAKGVPGVQSAGAGIIAKGYGRGGEQFALDVYANAYRFFVRNGAGAAQLVGPGVPVDGTWQHLVGTYDGANSASGLNFYINGQLAGSNTASSTVLSNRHEVSLGSREDNSSSGYNLPFYGTLDDARIYNRVLSAADVQELYLAAGAPPTIPDVEFNALRLLWHDMLTGGTNLNPADADTANSLAGLAASAQSLWSSMNKAAGRAYLWSDLGSLTNDSSQIWYTYDRLKTISLAYRTAGNTLYGNPSLRADLLSALDWMYANIYNETKSQYDNWWHWQIGVPLRLNDITVVLYDTLSGTQITNYMNAVNHFTPTPTGTAANLVWEATVVAVHGVIVKDSSKITAAAASLSSVFPYVTTSDGFYVDGSFIQHTYFPYTGSYGSSLIVFLAPILDMLDGSRWAVTDPRMTNVFQWVYNAYQPVIYRGAIMDMVRGRAISRDDETDQIIGQQTVAAIIRTAQFAPLADAAAFKSMAKYWIQSDTACGFTTNTDLGTLPLAQAILADPTVVSRGELLGHYHFGSMDRVAHLRPGYAFCLSLSSSRIANYESINSENLHGWYTADGMTYLYNADQIQFDDCFWPTINAYRLPGTTVDTQTRANGSGAGALGVYNWVGGAALGNWGAAGMQLDAWNSDLTAKKSWFMFDDEIVCLGAGITCTSNRAIETIVENRKLTSDGTNAFTVNGQSKPSALGWTETMSSVSWAHLAGNVTAADIGYYFPQPALLNGVREARTGAWYAINLYEIGSTTDPITRNYLTLWFNHGTNPVNTTYAYVLLPGLSAPETAGYAASPNVSLLQNSASIQAVSEGPLGVTAANFWNDGPQSAGGITVNRKASVLLQLTETNLTVAVADPTQTNTAGITVTINQAAAQTLSLDPGITVSQLAPALELTANTTGAAGKSLHASFLYSVTTFAGWQIVHFSPGQLADPAVSGPMADPDHDGLVNLLEYALVLDPWQPNGTGLQPGLQNGRFTLAYTRRKLATDLTYTVEVSTNLLAWDATGTQYDQTILSETPTAQTVQITDKSPANSQGARFYRLRVGFQP
jgi:hypothetical protein